MGTNLSSMYRTIKTDHFPKKMELSLYDDQQRQTLFYERVEWNIEGERKGLRYGENPDQEAALYKLVNGNLTLGEVTAIEPGRYLASNVELLQSGKHPGKTNITDADNALNILRYLHSSPCAVIVKHNNPCGVAVDDSLSKAYMKALMADRVAAFGGAVALNREVDRETAELISESYTEVVIAPSFADGVLDLFKVKKNLRVMRIGNMERLESFAGRQFLDTKALIDGGMILQWSFVPKAKSRQDLIFPSVTFEGKEYRVNRTPGEGEYRDMLFGWFVESGITSNSVIYVKDGVTVGIGTGEQDRVGVAEIARDKAYRKYSDRICWDRYGIPYNTLSPRDSRVMEIDEETAEAHGGLKNSIMISDAFFPFRDGVDVGLREGISAVLQPGGSLRDFEVIEACNEAGAAMMFTGQRSFRH